MNPTKISGAEAQMSVLLKLPGDSNTQPGLGITVPLGPGPHRDDLTVNPAPEVPVAVNES